MIMIINCSTVSKCGLCREHAVLSTIAQKGLTPLGCRLTGIFRKGGSKVGTTTVLTIGYSGRQAGALMALLAAQGATAVIDTRTEPVDEQALRRLAEQDEIVYHWAGRQLGHQYPADRDSPHHALDEGLRGYTDFMNSEAFVRPAEQLLNMALSGKLVIMADLPETQACYRRLLADYLLLQGVRVLHIDAADKLLEHMLSAELRYEASARIYDRFPVGSGRA